jgi:hypothetical protein
MNRRSGLRAIGGLAAVPLLSLLTAPFALRATSTGENSFGRTIRVGTDGEVASLAAAARIARDGDTVEVAPGDYRGDVAVWAQRDLFVRGSGERPRLIADGASAEGKAIFVARGGYLRIENLAFLGARVRDRNGAGIRLEKGRLELANCHFEDNENGILTANRAGIELFIDRCSFVENGAGDGQSHNLYVGAIERLVVTSSYFARARVGHLLKSRARENYIAYCRLSGEEGTPSYELEFPNGGVARVMGCLIQQGSRTENPTIISFGAEGYRSTSNELQLTFNTIVNDRLQGGTFIRVWPGPVRAGILDNLLVGRGTIDVTTETEAIRNMEARSSEFADPSHFDFRLRTTSPNVGAVGAAGLLSAVRALPEREYVHPADSQSLEKRTALTPLSPGAFQRHAP